MTGERQDVSLTLLAESVYSRGKYKKVGDKAVGKRLWLPTGSTVTLDHSNRVIVEP
jgi:hypothetical protein